MRVSKSARMGIDDSGINALRPPIQHKLFARKHSLALVPALIVTHEGVALSALKSGAVSCASIRGALALFGRRLSEHVVRSSLPASENLHMS